MAGRGPTSFQKRQKEQQRKEKQQAKLARRAQRKIEGPLPEGTTDPEDDNPPLDTDVDIENIGPAGIDRQSASVG